jgi:uncharacterized protein (DUF427 family)
MTTGNYPAAPVAAGHSEPCPRRIRATLAGTTVLDTVDARYVWEWPFYPQYYIPVEDVDRNLLVDENRERHLRGGVARRHGLRVDGIERPGTVQVYGEDAAPGVQRCARFDWDALDAWFEEDEQVFVHPRNPYTRVDALRSRRRVRVEVHGILLAESDAPFSSSRPGCRPATTSTETTCDGNISAPASCRRRARTRA